MQLKTKKDRIVAKDLCRPFGSRWLILFIQQYTKDIMKRTKKIISIIEQSKPLFRANISLQLFQFSLETEFSHQTDHFLIAYIGLLIDAN